MVTLKLLPYIFSKLAVLMALCIFQCGSMLAIVYLICGLHSNFFYDFLVLLLSSMIGAGLGLSISALTKTNSAIVTAIVTAGWVRVSGCASRAGRSANRNTHSAMATRLKNV